MHNKSVGIVVPIYNAAKYLEKCLHSISIQTYKNIKILLIDDGSTDKNVDKIIKSYIYKDSRFTSIKISNSGQGVARNIGIEHFINTDKTDYILFVDSDDYIDENCIEELIKNIDDADFIWFNFRYKFENTKPHSNPTSIENYNLQNKITISNKDWLELSSKIDLHSFASGCWVMIDTDYIQKLNLRYLDVHGEDNHFGVMLFSNANKIKVYPKKLYNYIIRNDSTINYSGKISINSIPFRLRKYLKYFYDNPMVFSKYYRAGGAAIMLSSLIDSFKDDKEIYNLLEKTFLNRYCMLALNLQNFPNDPLGYKRYLPLAQKYAKDHNIGAFALVQSSVYYWIGLVLISNKISLKNFLKTPFYIYQILNDKTYIKKYKFDIDNHWDKEYALKVLNHKAYKLGIKLAKII